MAKTINDGICPECNASMQGEPIPNKDREHYGNMTHFSRLLGVEYSFECSEHYDGISEWCCPDCGYREGRWSGKKLKEGELEKRFGGKP